jgi:hypothetical protein
MLTAALGYLAAADATAMTAIARSGFTMSYLFPLA